MRMITFAAGLFGFAAIAAAGQSVEIKSKTYKFEADYTYGLGTTEQATKHLAVTRKYKFVFPDAQADAKEQALLSIKRDGQGNPDDDNVIREYLEQDLINTDLMARKRAVEEKKSYPKVLKEMLDNLRYKTIDCRGVARQMVEALIGNRVEVKVMNDKTKLEQHRYQTRQDQLDVALVAKQLDRVTIHREPSITADDTSPHFLCNATAVNGDVAACGDLHLWFNPIAAAKGSLLEGRKAVSFDPNFCAKFEDIDFRACELNRQIKSCGLRNTQKASAPNLKDRANWGLDDVLEANKTAEIDARADGSYKAGPNAVVPTFDPSFYDEFQAPGSRPRAE